MTAKNLIIILGLIISTLTLHAQSFTPVNVFVPTFESPTGKPFLGYKTASILSLQIWRAYSSPTVEKSNYDNANILFNSNSCPKSYAEVEGLARKQHIEPNLVLWGKAMQYGDGIVVESSLLVRKNVGKTKLGTNIWSLEIQKGTKSYTISVDIPEWQYEFAPIVLDSKLVLDTTRPKPIRTGLINVEIYKLKSLASEVIGILDSSSVEAIEHDGDWSKVQFQDVFRNNNLGWIYLPNLSKTPSEVVNFCIGIIRILRHDWSGAVRIFQEVLKTDNVPTSIKVDSYLYMAIAYDKMHDETRSYSMVAEAYKLNPYSQTTTKYLCMSYLSHLARVLVGGVQTPEAKKIILSAQEALSKNKVLFAENDSWMRQVEHILAEITG
jgi:hypothetical protein